MQLYFIRHGESVNNMIWASGENYFATRSPDPELTVRGRQQAQLLAARLTQPYRPNNLPDDLHNTQGFGLTHIYSSLMIRAIETALPTAEILDLPIIALPDVCEFAGIFRSTDADTRFGLAGKTQAELEARFPRLRIDQPLPEGGWWGGKSEGSAELYARAKQALDFLLSKHGKDDRVAMISHGGFYRAFMALILNLPLDIMHPSKKLPLTLAINNTGITRIAKRENDFLLPYMNNVTHLPAHLITR